MDMCSNSYLNIPKCMAGFQDILVSRLIFIFNNFFKELNMFSGARPSLFGQLAHNILQTKVW